MHHDDSVVYKISDLPIQQKCRAQISALQHGCYGVYTSYFYQKTRTEQGLKVLPHKQETDLIIAPDVSILMREF
ncbi:hypothetical protein D3C86_1896770 [compost metagenome]